MNNAEYQAMPAISSHWLIAMLNSPAECWRKYLNPQRPAEAPSDALRLGTLVHTLALTPRQLEQEFIVADYERRSVAGKARYAELQATGKTPVRPAELEKARAVVAALRADPDARKLLRGGKKERTILQPRARGLLPLKARLDIHQESRREVVELKTTWNLATAEAAMTRYRYTLSGAFYRDLVRGQSVIFLFVQTREPYPVLVTSMTKTQLRDGERQWRTALERFDACWLKKDWPEAEPTPTPTIDDDPLMMPMPSLAANAHRRRFELPVGELTL